MKIISAGYNDNNERVTIVVSLDANEKVREEDVKIDNQDTFVCSSDASDVSQTGVVACLVDSTTNTETISIDLNNAVKPTTFDIKNDLLFVFLNVYNTAKESVVTTVMSIIYHDVYLYRYIWDKIKNIFYNDCCEKISCDMTDSARLESLFEIAISHKQYQDAVKLWKAIHLGGNNTSNCNCNGNGIA